MGAAGSGGLQFGGEGQADGNAARDSVSPTHPRVLEEDQWKDGIPN